MEKVNTIKMLLITSVGATGSIVAWMFGGWTKDLSTLLIFMGIDFAMGLLIAGFWKKSSKSKSGTLSSYSAWKGLIRKGVSLLVVLVAYRLDVTLGMDYIKTMVIIAFIANEGISIVENAGIMGVPMPEILKKAIEVLTKKGEGKDNEDKQ